MNTGKLRLPRPVRDFMDEHLPATQTRLLPATLDHVAVIATLPRHHNDPFDRLIIAQAIVDGLDVVGTDPAFDAYPVVRRW